ncbi:helix-turn-helix domain-containing protein [Nocardia sp. NPDC059180]|uniref:helix-turn-helix domain-containing protein n=1 Tax=Nocardia sp. NPDC059180 TaxID=3346761 RepID=UPI0036B2CCE3
MAIVTWTGLEVAALRAALRDTQVQFADRVGCSLEAVGKWERRGADIILGAKYSECMDTTHRMLDDAQRARFDAGLEDRGRAAAAALRPARTAATYPAPRPRAAAFRPVDDATTGRSSNDSCDDGMFHFRRVLLGCIPDSPPREQLELGAAVDRAWDLFFSARFYELKRELPAALASAYSAAGSAVGEPLRRINIALAKLLHACSNFLGYVAHEDLAALALLRAETLAAESGDELTVAAIKGSQSWLFAKNGMYDDAAAYADRTATHIERRLSTATPRRIAIWGELLCYAAFAASGAGDHREARRYLRLCESAGTQVEGDYASRPEPSNVFGYTSAASFGVVNEIGASRPREALKLAAVISDSGNGIPPTLRSRWLINVA